MRILKFLLTIALIVGLLGATAFLVTREVMLFIATNRVRDSVQQLKKAATKNQNFLELCLKQKIAGAHDIEILSVELAFLNDRQYQLQMICSQFVYEPVVLESYTLPRFVTKAPGSSGLVWSATESTSITLEMWGRQKTLTLTKDKLASASQPNNTDAALSPLTKCEGFGYTCCQDASQLGQGEQVTNVLNCPKSCFAQCVSRPVVLSLNTQPFFEPSTRTVSVVRNEPISFHYVVDSGAAEIKELVLDLGDGQQQTSASASGTFTHSYFCTEPICQYRAELKVTNTQGISNVNSGINSLIISVTSSRY